MNAPTHTLALGLLACVASATLAAEPASRCFASRRDAAALLMGYFERMCEPKPFVVREGAAFRAHQRQLRQKLLECAGLWPLPERVPLDAQVSLPLDHEWCRIRRVAYQLWPGVYADGLLFAPKKFGQGLSPAVLCPHGHWPDGNAHPEVQRRCLVLARMGYVVFSPTQNHYEDPALGVSHQTLMIWANLRALDYLQTLPEVDKDVLGCAGASGGGLQTQMLVAIDDRIRAATICGMTCDYREIVFPGRAHCRCNHLPHIMRHTDQPEISTLGLPTPVQYLTMNDWTRRFEKANFPTVQRLYKANGFSPRVDCKYWPTAHSYDQPKRERTTWWMDRWLRQRERDEPRPEPVVKTLPIKALQELEVAVPMNRGFAHISRHVERAARYRPVTIGSRDEWLAYRRRQRATLRDLLGEAMPAKGQPKPCGTATRDGLVVERVLVPSEAGILVPTIVLRPADAKGKLPATVIADPRGKAALLADATALARQGRVVALPDVRFVGELSLHALAGLTGELATFKACSPLAEGKPESFDGVWERNALLWGRPIPGMAATDMAAVVGALSARADVDAARVELVGRGRLAVAALFAAALDDRVRSADVDLGGHCFQRRDLPLVPFVLRHGDVLQWAALLADRTLALRGVPKEAGDPRWLADAFRAAGNPGGLTTVSR